MLGNLLILVGPRAYNGYSYKLTSTPMIFVFEVILLFSFLAHIAIASRLAIKNKKARLSSYKVKAFGDKGTSLIHRTLWYQGILIFVFVVLHLVTFKFGPHYDFMLDGKVVRDFYKLVVEVFRNPYVVLWYLIAQLVIGFHIGHGAYAIFQTLGLYHEKWLRRIKGFCRGYAVLITVGFSILPLYVYFFK